MKIAILSDVHDHRINLDKCIASFMSLGVDHIIHLGDYGAPISCIKPLIDLGIPITGIRGNNDGEAWMIMKLFENSEHAEMLRTTYGEITLGGTKIFMTHYNDLAPTIAQSGLYDIVLYGHNHQRDNHKLGTTIVINPGAICGDRESASYVMYDTEMKQVEHIII